MYKQQRFDFNQSGDSSIGLPDGPCALTELWSWGHNGLNQLGTNDEIDHIEPIKLNSLSTKGLIKIFAKENLSFAISSTYDIHVWGDGNCVTKVIRSRIVLTQVILFLKSMSERVGHTTTLESYDMTHISIVSKSIKYDLIEIQSRCISGPTHIDFKK